MSGGSMEYLYRRVEDASFATNTPERRAFAAHLKLVAKALHDIEWVDSGDCDYGDESAAIRACLSPADTLQAATATAEEALEALREELARSRAGTAQGLTPQA